MRRKRVICCARNCRGAKTTRMALWDERSRRRPTAAFGVLRKLGATGGPGPLARP